MRVWTGAKLGEHGSLHQRIRSLTLTSQPIGTRTPAAAAGTRRALLLRDSARRRRPVPNTDIPDELRAQSETKGADETSIDQGTVRLLESGTWQPGRAGSRGHRARRHPQGIGRYVYSVR